METTSPNGKSQSLIIATAGHVDHGKTALVKHLTGTNTDTLAEEKSRGLTINLGYAYHHFERSVEDRKRTYSLGFVDVPGHTDFINNMLAGVGGVEFALLIVAADDGIMPQTEEHLAVLNLMGIASAAIVITKIDKVDAARVAKVAEELRQIVKKTRFENSPCFEVSNIERTGIDALRLFLEDIALRKTFDEKERSSQRLRYLVDRSFVAKGIGTIVTGTVSAGTIRVGDTLTNTQTGKESRVKGLRMDTSVVEQATSGQRVAANISSESTDISRGAWLIDREIYHPVHRIDVKLFLENPSFGLKPSAQYHLHIGASHSLINVRCLDRESSIYQFNLASELHCLFGDRFVIRDPSATQTLGGGVVLDTFVPRRQRASEERLNALQVLDQSPEKALTDLLHIEARGINIVEFSINRNLGELAIAELLSLVAKEIIVLRLKNTKSDIWLGAHFFKLHCKQITEAVQAHHMTHPNQQGITEPALSLASKLPGSYLLFQSILDRVIEAKTLRRTGTLIHSPAHSTQLSKEEEEFIAKIRPILKSSGQVPPRTRELVEMTGIQLKPLERILKLCTKSGHLVKVADNRHYLPETILKLAEFTESLQNENADDSGFSVIQFRDLSGIGRNLCIEILEYFDAVGFTRRDGNSRFVRTAKENIFTS